MLTNRGPESRGERLVLAARATIAVAATLALPRHLLAGEPHGFFVGLWGMYVLYVVSMAIATWNSGGSAPATRALDHSIDLVAMTMLTSMTEGPVSPFFIAMFLPMSAATIRFNGRAMGIAATSVMMAAAAVSGVSALIQHTVAPDIALFRTFALAAIGAVLILSTTHRQAIETELARLSSWTRGAVLTESELIDDLLERAAAMLHVRRVLLAFDDGTTRLGYVRRSDREPVVEVIEPSVVSGLFDLPIGGQSLFVRDPAGSKPAVVHMANDRFEPAAVVIDADVVSSLQAKSMLIVPFEGELLTGRIIFLDRGELSTEDVALAELFAGIVSSRLEQFRAAESLRGAAVADERVRVGRDLHDWLLQSLTGAALQLSTLHKLMERDPAAARARLLEIQQLLSSDQSELRWFIDQLQPGPHPRSSNALLTDRLAALAERFRRQWDLRIEMEVAPVVQLVRDSLRQEIYAIVNEAVANAAKHANATRVTVEVKVESDAIQIVVRDNGRGFPFSGSYDLRALVNLKRGPVTLKERIASLGGNLIIDSHSDGARLQITVPISGDPT